MIMKQIREVIISVLSLILSFGILSILQANVVSEINTDLSESLNIYQAQPDAEPDCMSWGYRTWNYWASGVDGVDCDCKEREKVWTPCAPD